MDESLDLMTTPADNTDYSWVKSHFTDKIHLQNDLRASIRGVMIPALDPEPESVIPDPDSDPVKSGL